MRFRTNSLLRDTCFSGLCLFTLIFTGCTGSDDPVQQPVDPGLQPLPVVNVAPVAVDDIFTVIKGSTTPLELASNDTDADDGLDLASIEIVAAAVNGIVTVNADGTIDYAHDGSGTVSDTLSYTIKDNSGAVSNIADVAITITSPVANVAPVAVDDVFDVIKGSTTPLGLASNDTDADDGLNLASIEIVAAAVNGAVTVNANGTIDYAHDGSDTVSDSLSYTIKDNSGAVSNIADVAITIMSPVVNVAPVAVDDDFTVIEGSTTPLELASNDTDADDGLNLASIEIVAAAANGAVTVNADGSIDYAHDGSGTVSDTLSYTIKDNSGAVSNIADVTITITPSAPPATVKLGIYDSTVVEAADDLEFVISLSAASSEIVSVDYATENGTASAGADYSSDSGTLQFAPGELRKFIPVAVLNNASAPTLTGRNMQLVLSKPQNALLGNSAATGTIIDKDKTMTDTAFLAAWGQKGAFTNAVACNNACHVASGTIMYFDDKDISPGKQWKHSVMANAFNDPYWQAAVEDEVDSFPDLTGLIEDTCTTCHAPMGRTHAYHTNTDLDTDGYFRFDTAKTQNHSREAVSCTLCHQIDHVNLGTPGSFSGGFEVQGDPLASDYKDIYGPYVGPATKHMDDDTGHKPVFDPYITKSELCATCHTLYTPALDPDTGIPSGTSFLEQGTYLEWQNSVYATAGAQEAQCQSCHMPEPEAEYGTKISNWPKGVSARTPYAQHTLVGGNAHLLEILRDYRSALGIASSTTSPGFDDQITLTKKFLGSAALLTVSAPVDTGSSLNFDIAVVNNTGHKLPSGYPSRRMWLHVVVKNSADEIIFESGKPDSRGYLSNDEERLKADCMSAHKLEGFDSSLCYEPHRDVINDESQVMIYETVLGDVNDEITHTLLQAARYLKDNRIPPKGFINDNATEIKTIPSGVNGDDDFNCVVPDATEGCGADTAHYQVNIEGQSGPYAVETRLLYQATQPGFVDGMHNVGDRVNRFKVMYDAVPPSIEVLATVP